MSFVERLWPEMSCFLCNEPINEEFIVWSGTRSIYFHPDCVPSFCRRLLEDWERSKGGDPAVDRLKDGTYYRQ